MPQQSTDYDEILQKLEYAIKGYEYKDGKWSRSENRSPYLNSDKRGFSKVMSVLRAYLGTHISLSNLTRPFIRTSIISLMFDLSLDFYKNMEIYGFSSKEDCDVVLGMVKNQVLATMLRAVDGKEMGKYYDTVRETIQTSQGGTQVSRL